jgi:hypothetical protein
MDSGQENFLEPVIFHKRELPQEDPVMVSHAS